MVRECPSVVTVLRVVLCILRRPTPFATQAAVIVNVSAAVLKRITMFDAVSVSRTELPSATFFLACLDPSTDAAAPRKNAGDPLRRHGASFVLRERAH